ncbi:hypothetical protein SSX86_031203 [Deinandra increscens subsp. villosa]|uniref:SPIRAL1-like1 n=1 Tax=Deinandra increscens subsp. villosa TaxID=3103831 RepID=A0AAP0C4M2_9ASTR
MGRGVGYSRGQSSLGYLFGDGGGETGGKTQPPPQNPSAGAVAGAGATTEPSRDTSEPSEDENKSTVTDELSEKLPESFSVINQNPNFSAHHSLTNNYHRADGQNCGNFITNRLSTKVHAPPGGSSSLGYLFGGDKK